jgi:hypothetical protein
MRGLDASNDLGDRRARRAAWSESDRDQQQGMCRPGVLASHAPCSSTVILYRHGMSKRWQLRFESFLAQNGAALLTEESSQKIYVSHHDYALDHAQFAGTPDSTDACTPGGCFRARRGRRLALTRQCGRPPMWRRGSLSGRRPVLRGYRVRAALARLGMPGSIGATVRPAVCWDHSQTWVIGRAKAASTCFTTSTPAQLRSAKSPLPSLGGAPVGPHRVPLASRRCAACKSTALPCVHARCPLPLRLNVPQRPTPGRHSVRDPPTVFGCSLFQGEEARRTLDVACARPIVST